MDVKIANLYNREMKLISMELQTGGIMKRNKSNSKRFMKMHGLAQISDVQFISTLNISKETLKLIAHH